jgi:cysteine-rich repeat protein
LPADGALCEADGLPNTRDICRAGACRRSRCGDSFLDPETEECDDGDEVDGDGCDSCEFSCEVDGDCGDGRECTGEERCRAVEHLCRPGDPPADGTPCRDGVGACRSAVCLLSSCGSDAECSDLDPCNGEERCGAAGCELGAPPVCDDGDPCTADGCDPIADERCFHRLVDADGDGFASTELGAFGADCDDVSREAFPGAPERCNARDDDCDGLIDEGAQPSWYVDCDGDGYAPIGARAFTSCTVPSGALTGCPGGGFWTVQAPAERADCHDAHPMVHPGQRTYQSSPIHGEPDATDFDYDCNGVESELFGEIVAVCEQIEGRSCRRSEGWFGERPPCGSSGLMLADCRPILGPSGDFVCVRIPDTTLRNQLCL